MLILGVAIILIGTVVILGGNHVAPHAIPRAAGMAFAATGGGLVLVGLVVSWFELEAQRRRHLVRVPIWRFYRRQMRDQWRSLPPSAKVAVGVVPPITAVAFSVLAWLGVSGRLVVGVLALGLLVSLILLAIAGRNQA
jgi:hypothetical protein